MRKVGSDGSLEFKSSSSFARETLRRIRDLTGTKYFSRAKALRRKEKSAPTIAGLRGWPTLLIE